MERDPSLEELNSEQSSCVAGDGSSIDRVIRESVKFEQERFVYNVDRGELEYSSTTFLGCGMEMLRSSLAKWAERNNGGDEGSWRPSLFLTDDVHERDNAKFVCQFSASADFTSCLESVQCLSDMAKRIFKMRVLWELQNHLQTHLPEDGVAPSQGEAIALCILSFPALYVDAGRMVVGGECVVILEPEDENVLRMEDYGYVIHTTCGPQDIKVRVSFKRREDTSNVEISISIHETEATGGHMLRLGSVEKRFLRAPRRVSAMEGEVGNADCFIN